MAVVVLVTLAAVVGGGLWLRSQLNPPGDGEDVTVEVPVGSSTHQIAAILDERGVVRSARVFELYVRAKGEGPFQAGTYRLRRGASFDEVVARMERGAELTYQRLTVPEGLTVRQVADRVGALPGRSAERFLELVNSGNVRSRYQAEGSDSLEGLLFPDTYQLEAEDDERAILERMVSTFDAEAGRSGIDKVTEGGLVSPYQAVTVASLVEREARVSEDRGMIARVIYNRLQRGMRLEVDATIIYAQGRSGEPGLRLLNKDKEVASPYNTYKVAGLPPTPIASPGRASLEAAVDPPPGPWLYYVVAEPSGKHAFGTTLEEHNRNVALARSKGVL